MRKSSKLSDELKQAISGLSPKEKDRLLYRLIAKDTRLVEQLRFKLLENNDAGAMEDRRLEVQQRIDTYFRNSQFHSPGYLLLDIRMLSGFINRHVSATKDKYGEIFLNFHMLNLAFEYNAEAIKLFQPYQTRTFHEYVIKRAMKLLNLLFLIHEDYRLDFEEPMQRLGKYMMDDPVLFQRLAAYDLDVKWLLKGELPDW